MRDIGQMEGMEMRKALVDEAIYLRGRIIASYAQVEFLLADLISKLEDRFAYRIESRIKGVRNIAEMARQQSSLRASSIYEGGRR